MPVKELGIALAAQTPIFLPILVAHHEGYFGLVDRNFRIKLVYPQPEIKNHDGWVHDQIIRTDYSNANPPILFGVCDPFQAFSNTTSRVIGALVTKTAFWGLDTNTPMESLSDTCNFDEIIAYPDGMTAHLPPIRCAT